MTTRGAVVGRAAVVMAAALLAAGCYNYLPLRRSRLAPSTYVAVTLTESGSEELAPYIGPNVLIVRGRFLSASERGLALSVAAVETRRGESLEWKGETVTVPGEFVRALEKRQVAHGKTALLAGASLAGFLAAYAAFGSGSRGTATLGGGGGSNPH